MFCPKCAAQNLDGASFCRTCGANISLVPQALTGQLAQAPEEEMVEHHGRRRRRQSKEATLDHAFKNIFMGVAFLIVAIALSRTIGHAWWFWMLLPAFSMMGTGVAQYIRVREREKRAPLAAPPVAAPPVAAPPVARAFPERRAPIPSVTEGTTRHLDPNKPQ